MELTTKLFRALSQLKFHWILIFVGIGLRLRHFLDNRSLWLDEAWVALGISTQSLDEILSFTIFSPDLPLPPVGFLFVQKLLIDLFGNNEYVLRVFPLIAGSVSVVLFYLFLRKNYSYQKTLIALSLFVFCESAIYYASEVKQYSTDLLCALMLLLVAQDAFGKKYNKVQFVLLSFLGCISLLFSHTATFVLAAIGIALLVDNLLKKNYRQVLLFLLVCLSWLCCFMFLFVFSYGQQVGNVRLIQGAIGAQYYPFGVFFSGETVMWLAMAFLRVFENPLGVFPIAVWAAMFFLGIGVVFEQKKVAACLLVLPIFFVLTAAFFQKYLFGGRYLLFAVPMIIVILIEGAFYIFEKFSKAKSFATLFFVVTILFFPMKSAIANWSKGHHKEGAREVVKYFKEHRQVGDALYLNNSAQYGFGYYHGYYRLGTEPLPVGYIPNWPKNAVFSKILIKHKVFSFNAQGFLNGLLGGKGADIYLKKENNVLKNNSRTWIMLIHGDKNQNKVILSHLNKVGKKLDHFYHNNADIYLYDLSVQEN